MSFAAWTSGWSNGLMPRIEPATATANSQRKNSPPMSYGSGIRGSAAWRSRPSGLSPGAGTRPVPRFPVDSATSCSAQSPKRPSVSAMQTLSRPSRQRSPSSSPSSSPGFRSPRHASAVCSAFERSALDVDPHQRGRDDPERRERGVAAPDRRLTREDLDPAGARLLLERRAGVRDRDELRPVAGLRPEVLEVRQRLERGPRLRRDDEHRPVEVEGLLGVPDHLRVRRVEHVQVVQAERPFQHLWCERRAAHPEQDERVEPRARRLRELDDVAGPLQHALRLVEPAQPPILVGAGPDRRVASPDPLDEVLLRGDRHRYAGASSPRFARMPSSSSVNESMNFWTPSRSSVSVTSS